MGIKTQIYKIDNDLAINIPRAVLPSEKIQLVEQRVEIPGEPAETATTYPLLVRAYPIDTKTLKTVRLLIPKKEMERLGLDPYEQIFIKLPNRTEWYPAHIFHGYYGRVTIPIRLARELELWRYHGELYPVFISGKTFPKTIIRYIKRPMRTVIINHIGIDYPAENYGPDKWRWRIPKTIESYPILEKSITLNIYPSGECHLDEGIIYVDFIISKAAARVVAEAMGYAFRNMAVRNYTATSEIIEYPFLCEIRATYLSCTPKMFYQPTEKQQYNLKKALEITVYNLMQYFFPSSKKGQKYSSISFAEHIGSIEWTNNRVNLKQEYPKIKNAPDITSYGDSTDEELEIPRYPYYYAIKYIRIINEDVYKDRTWKRFIYNNNKIEGMLLRAEDDREMNQLPSRIWIDDNGFVWKTY